MIIVDQDVDDQTGKAQIARVVEMIEAGGGTVPTVDHWGRRRFAYPINKKEDGYYVVYNVEAPAGALDEVERTLRIADNVVRHKLLRLPDHEAQRRGMLAKA